MFTIDLTREFPNLPKSPVVEAVIQITAAPSVPLDQTVLHEELLSRFADYELTTLHEMAARFEIEELKQKNMEFKARWDGFRLKSQDDKYVIQFKPDSVVVSRLAPYESWPQFTNAMHKYWNAYLELAKPKAIDKVGVRFISRINLKENESPSAYVDDAPATLTAIGLVAESFFHKDTFPTMGHPFTVNLARTIQLQEPPLPRKSLIVDIDITTTDALSLNGLQSNLEKMRFIKNEVFFAFMRNAESRFS